MPVTFNVTLGVLSAPVAPPKYNLAVFKGLVEH